LFDTIDRVSLSSVRKFVCDVFVALGDEGFGLACLVIRIHEREAHLRIPPHALCMRHTIN